MIVLPVTWTGQPPPSRQPRHSGCASIVSCTGSGCGRDTRPTAQGALYVITAADSGLLRPLTSHGAALCAVLHVVRFPIPVSVRCQDV